MTDSATLARIEDHLRRQAEATERIADALGTRPQLDAVPRDPTRCEPGCTRPSLHGGDCSPAEANEYAPGGWASTPVSMEAGEYIIWPTWDVQATDLATGEPVPVSFTAKRVDLAPRSCAEPKPGYHCTRGAHDAGEHTWTPNEEPAKHAADPLDESGHRPPPHEPAAQASHPMNDGGPDDAA